MAFVVGHAQKPSLSGFDVGEDVALAVDLDVTGEEVAQRLGAAAIGHVQDVDLGRGLHALARHLGHGAGAGGPERDLAGVGLCVGHELLHRRRGQ